MCKAMSSGYVREVSGMQYKKENYNDKPECKVNEKSYEKIRRHLIVIRERYIIW